MLKKISYFKLWSQETLPLGKKIIGLMKDESDGELDLLLYKT